jgi:uncharacterized protein (TIGR02996 family)
MTDELLRAALDADDDAELLVYADWLQQRGDPRGELITVQCRLAGAAESERTALEAREAALLREHADRWLGVWRGLATAWSMRRGFLDRLVISADRASSAAIRDASPGAPELVHLRSLDVRSGPDRLGRDELRAIFSIGERARLERLRLALGLPAGSLEDLAASPWLGRVGALHLAHAVRGDEDARVLLGSPYLGAVRTLELSGAKLTDGAALALAGSPYLAGIVELDVSSIDVYDPGCNNIGDRGAIALVTSSHATALARLDVGENERISDAFVHALVRSPLATRLVDLGLDFTMISDAAQLAALTGLEALRIDHTRIGDETAVAVAALPRLGSLDLSGTQVTAGGLRQLLRVASPTLRRLRARVSGLDLDKGLLQALRERFELDVLED